MTANDYIQRLEDDFVEKRPGSLEKWGSYLQERDRDDAKAVNALVEIEKVAKWLAESMPFAIKIVSAYIRLGFARSEIIDNSSIRLQQALASYTAWKTSKPYDGVDRRKPPDNSA